MTLLSIVTCFALLFVFKFNLWHFVTKWMEYLFATYHDVSVQYKSNTFHEYVVSAEEEAA